jgi:tRNA A-37 threonylcarbamoyl transferase component Bud32
VIPPGRSYEDEACALFASFGWTAAARVEVQGARARHAIDVLVTFTLRGVPQKWVIECKDWKTRIPKEKVLALQKVVEDVGANVGILLSEIGFQPGAKAAASYTNIALISLAELRGFQTTLLIGGAALDVTTVIADEILERGRNRGLLGPLPVDRVAAAIAPPLRENRAGTLFDSRYRIIRLIGAGGTAHVYLAEDEELSRRVALKILYHRYASDEEFVERFRREAQAAAGLAHPNIVSVFDRGEADDTYYIVMEFVEGRSLKELILNRGPAPFPVVVDYARQILAALRVAHRQGLVHRDIKPHNVLIDDEGRAKVTDFGIARGAESQLTLENAIIGSVHYLSPEQGRGASVDTRSDIYSLGIVLYELITGTVPFDGASTIQIVLKHVTAAPEPLSIRRPGTPHDLELITLRALTKEPDDRYQTASEMDADLGRFSRGVSVDAKTREAAGTALPLPQALPPQGVAFDQMVATGRELVPTPPPAPPPVYYDYEEPPERRRPLWQGVAAAGGVITLAILVWLVATHL